MHRRLVVGGPKPTCRLVLVPAFRLDLDGAWSAAAVVSRILEIERDLPIPVPIEQLCAQLDIESINELHTEGFEAALLADGVKSIGSILVKLFEANTQVTTFY